MSCLPRVAAVCATETEGLWLGRRKTDRLYKKLFGLAKGNSWVCFEFSLLLWFVVTVVGV